MARTGRPRVLDDARSVTMRLSRAQQSTLELVAETEGETISAALRRLVELGYHVWRDRKRRQQ